MSEFEGKGQLSGLTGAIRSAVSSEQFDLGGYNEQRTKELIRGAFAQPLEAPTEMVKFTFVVGGGKLVRSRYAEELPKWTIAALREVGYVEDRSAAETFDSQGSYKQQHDTGQNLKYVIVFPHVTCASATAKEPAAENTADMVNQTSPEWITVACELTTLQDIVATKCPSYKQRKKLLQHLQHNYEEFQRIEAKLVSGAPLDSREDLVYSANSGMDAEKIAWLQVEIKGMVDNGKLTAAEKADLMKSMRSNEQAVANELEVARSEGKTALVTKLTAKKEAISARCAMVDGHSPVEHRLGKSADIQKLYMRLFPLRALEDKGRSMSLTLSDLRTLEEKADIEEAIHALQAASRGWFQDEDDFLSICQLEESKAQASYKLRKKSTAGKKTGGTASVGQKKASKTNSNSAGWTTATPKTHGFRTGAGFSAGKGSGNTNTFAAAFADSDSD